MHINIHLLIPKHIYSLTYIHACMHPYMHAYIHTCMHTYIECLLLSKVKHVQRHSSVKIAEFDQCQFGLVSLETKTPVKKRTRVMTNSPELLKALDGYFCPGDHPIKLFLVARGGETLKSSPGVSRPSLQCHLQGTPWRGAQKELNLHSSIGPQTNVEKNEFFLPGVDLGSEKKVSFFTRLWIGVRKREISEGFIRNLRKSEAFWNRNQCLERKHVFFCRSQHVKSNHKDLKVSIETFRNS